MSSQTTNRQQQRKHLSCATFTLPEDQDQDQRQGKGASAPGGTKPFPIGESGPEIFLDKNHLGNNLWCIQGCMKEQTARSGTEHRKRPAQLLRVPAGPKKNVICFRSQLQLQQIPFFFGLYQKLSQVSRLDVGTKIWCLAPAQTSLWQNPLCDTETGGWDGEGWLQGITRRGECVVGSDGTERLRLLPVGNFWCRITKIQ